MEFLAADVAAWTHASRQASLEQTQEYRSAQWISLSILSVSSVTIYKTSLIHNKDTAINHFFLKRLTCNFFALSGHWENGIGQLSPLLWGGPTGPLTIKSLISPYRCKKQPTTTK